MKRTMIMLMNLTITRTLLLAAGLMLATDSIRADDPEKVFINPTGIADVSRGKLVLTIPPDRPPHGCLRYALAFPFQAGPHTVGLMVMRMTEETTNYGFLDGSDVILLDELKRPRREQIFAASRNEIKEGKAGASPRLFMKSPLIGGFVPLGALRPDGSPHPHAGTGFGVGQAHWFPFPGGRFIWWDPERKDMTEVYQLAYDGKTFACRRTEVRTQNADDPLWIADTGWLISVVGISNAIPDGDDLLLATRASRIDRSASGVGVVRWACQNGTWQPVGYDPVQTNTIWWDEPSLAREADGSLLFSARTEDVTDRLNCRMAVWHSASGGEWRKVLDVPDARMNSPVTVNVAADGSAYLVSTPFDRAFIPETPKTGRGRENLAVWPLTADRTGLECPLQIRNCLAEFGEPPLPVVKGAEVLEKWMADHPNGMTVRLKDGGWHHILCYRVCHSPPYASYGTTPSPHSGAYIEEVVSRGPAQPVWQFAEEK